MDRISAVNLSIGAIEYEEQLNDAVGRVLRSGMFILGREVEEFERNFAAYHGIGHAVGVGSGTDALILALKALGIGPGDEFAIGLRAPDDGHVGRIEPAPRPPEHQFRFAIAARKVIESACARVVIGHSTHSLFC